ncbi:MAG: hypothetical protein Q7R96_00050 [Nanoarchaeota archaeon]|nr:hypothetical protein [Nanoarchaeota archaeon]
MQKKGQVYILAVIILAFIIYTLFTDTNVVKPTIIENDFDELAANYGVESAKLVNYLLSKNINNAGDIRNNFTLFTTTFTSYSKTKNPSFGLLYLFHYKDKLYIGNYLEEATTIVAEGQEKDIQGCLRTIPAGFKLAGATIHVGIDDVDIYTQNTPCVQTLDVQGADFTYNVAITVYDEEGTGSLYTTTITKGKPDVVIISRSTNDNTRRVYTKGRFMNTINLEEEE